jgi:proline iminopeptidase
LVVCVPGGPGMDPEAYFAAMDLPGFELLIFAPRGTGASSWPAEPEGYRMAGFVDDLESLRVYLGMESLTLYGNSHGGCIALAYACRSPERVHRMVITNAPPRMDDAYKEAVAEVQRRFSERFLDGAERLAAAESAYELMNATEVGSEEWRRHYRTLMARYVAKQGPAETAYLDRLCAAPINFESVGVMYAEFTHGLDLLENASQVTSPALAVAGEFDVVVPPAAMGWIADALPNGRYFEFKGVGHFPEVEAGHQFSELVSTFLAE